MNVVRHAARPVRPVRGVRMLGALALLVGMVWMQGGCAWRGRPEPAPTPAPIPTPDASDASSDTAEGVEGAEPSDESGMLATVARFVDTAQSNASARLGVFMYELDDFFAGESQSDEPNTSFMRVRLDAKRAPLDGFELDPSVKLRVVLPRSEQRLRLLLSTEDDLDDRSDGVANVTSVDARDQSLSLALRFVRRARDSTRLDADLGTRQREGRLQLFGRFNAEYREKLGERVELRVGNRYYYYSTSGFDDRLQFDLTRSLSAERSRLLRASTTFDWRKGRKGAHLNQVLGAYADLTAHSAIALEARATYHTALNGEVRERYRGHELRVRYRRNVWRPWLFYEFWPAVTWPAELDYRRTWNGLLRLEITIDAGPVEQSGR